MKLWLSFACCITWSLFGTLHCFINSLLCIWEESKDPFNAFMGDSQPIKDLYFDMNHKIFYLLIEILVFPFNKRDNEVDDLGPFLSLNPFMIIMGFFVFQGWIEHRKGNLNQFHCLNKMKNVHNRRTTHLPKTYPTKSPCFHWPSPHNNCCWALSLPKGRKVRSPRLLSVFYAELHFLWSSYRKFVKSMTCFPLFLPVLWKVTKRFQQESNWTF